MCYPNSGVILGKGLANERWCYIVTSFLIAEPIFSTTATVPFYNDFSPGGEQPVLRKSAHML